MAFDPEEIGLKVGLEIHQQLATKSKLFCECSNLPETDFQFNFIRRLRPTQSELGQIDPAALFEFKKGMSIKYLAGSKSACLVEADEEPPHDINKEAIESAILIALMLKSNVVDEIHVMRKIVIDGSNTTGFQRTFIVALGGALQVGNKTIPVQTICLEEDACRLLNEGDKSREYSLDRLGVPLIEVALAPFTGTPQEVQEVALALGRLLRSTKRVARGLGTIRQDLNISIKGGGIVEVKGVQKLDLLGKIVEFEVHRQLALIEVGKRLRDSGLTPNDFNEDFVDVSDIFKGTGSLILKRALERRDLIIASKLKNCKGLLKYEPYPDVRLGKELADLVRFYGLGGIIHSDELPNYGISEDEINRVRERLRLDDEDAFIILIGSE
ncbi:MAG: Glu-tRNA(Gln) amidotransferase subunit GatE, partial [Nitrososphaerales archaeon]|nr:Glu-tRNA(Gln) amidotransferase subunit GatE [Nitrososphaerales archaeon]